MASFYSWKTAVWADWGVAGDWSLGVVPNDPLDSYVQLNPPGNYTVSIVAGESFSVYNLIESTGTLALSGNLAIAGPSALSAGATITGGGVINGGGSLLSGGVISGTASGAFLQIGMTGFTNQGTVQANFGNVFIVSTNFSNLSGNVLTGGVYEVDGPASGNVSSILVNIGAGTISEVVTDSATITLNGEATAFAGANGNTNNPNTNLEYTLATITAGGVLNLIGGRDYYGATALVNAGSIGLGGGSFIESSFTSSGVVRGFGTVAVPFTNSGTIEAAGGVLTLRYGATDGGSLIVDPNAVLATIASFARPIVNNGILQAEGGLLKLSGAVSGAGSFLIDSPNGAGALSASTGTLELSTPVSGQVAFNGPGGVLKLDTPGSFTGTIVGFGQGDLTGRTADTIDLAGIVANSATLVGNKLQLKNNGGTVYSLNIAGSYTAGGITFAAGTDGAGGTNLTVTGIFARDYNFAGPYWHSKTITWSYATSNLPLDASNVQFSDFMTTPGTLPGDTRSQSVYQAVVQQALATWAGIEGFNFVQVPDSANADLRFGWGNFGSGGEIGQAAYSYQTDTMLADSIIRLQDPTRQALDSSTLIGGLVYHGSSSSLYQVAVHEIGHSLGLAHSTDINAEMFPSAGGAQNQSPNAGDTVGMQTLYAAVACFAAGTRIATGRGSVRVESLRIGDEVPGLASGERRRVRWIGQRALAPSRHARPQDVQPVRIEAGAFAPGRPERALRLSPDHAVLVEGGLVPVRYLVNGASVRQEWVRRVTYFHVELEDLDGRVVHDALAAEGLAVESYLDTGNRSAFAGEAALLLHPDFSRDVWAAAGFAPLRLEGPVVETARRRLLARAPALGHVIEDDPELRLVGRAGSRVAFARSEHTWRFQAPAGRVVLQSRSAVPAQMREADPDTRRLGVAVARLALDGKVIPLDDARLGAGFLPIETAGPRRWRWTEGTAALRLERAGRLDVTLFMTLPYWRKGPDAGRRAGAK